MFYALDKHKGTVVWRYDIGRDGDQTSFHGDMLITEKLVVIGTDGRMGHIYAFEKQTGKVVWKYPVQNQGAPTDILRYGSNIYTVTFEDELVCLDLNSGKRVWSFKSGFEESRRNDRNDLWPNSPALSNDRVFFGSLDGKVYAFNPESGQLIWTKDIGVSVSTSVIAFKKALYFGAEDDYFYRLSQDEGKIISKYNAGNLPIGRPTVTEEGVFVYLDPSRRGWVAGILLGLDLSLKNKLWSKNLKSNWSTKKSYIWNGYLLSGSSTGEVIAYKPPQKGIPRWMIKIEEQPRSIGESGNMLYIGTIAGMIYAVDTNHEKVSITN